MRTNTVKYDKPNTSAKARLKVFLKGLTNVEATAFQGSLIFPVSALIFAALTWLLPVGAYHFLFWLVDIRFFEDTVIGGMLFWPLWFIVFPVILAFAMGAGLLTPIMIFGQAISRRFAMATANAQNRNAFQFAPATAPDRRPKEWVMTILTHLLIVEPLFIIKKVFQLIGYITRKAFGAEAKWVTEQEAYYRDQMEIFRAYLIHRNEVEAVDYLFRSSYGAHYGPSNEIQWFHATNPAIMNNLQHADRTDLVAAKQRWVAGTGIKVLDELSQKFGRPAWLKELSNTMNAEEKRQLLISHGPCKLHNGQKIVDIQCHNGRNTLIVE